MSFKSTCIEVISSLSSSRKPGNKALAVQLEKELEETISYVNGLRVEIATLKENRDDLAERLVDAHKRIEQLQKETRPVAQSRKPGAPATPSCFWTNKKGDLVELPFFGRGKHWVKKDLAEVCPSCGYVCGRVVSDGTAPIACKCSK